MLLEKFPNTAGLHDNIICFCDTLAFPCDPPNDAVQILNITNYTHWICISSKDCTIKVYDSLRSGDLPLSIKEVIAALVKWRFFPFSWCPAIAQLVKLWTTLCGTEDSTKMNPLMQTHFLVFRKRNSLHFHQLVPCTSQPYHYQPVSESTVFVIYQTGVIK